MKVLGIVHLCETLSRVYCLDVSDFVMLVSLVCNLIRVREMSSFLIRFFSSFFCCIDFRKRKVSSLFRTWSGLSPVNKYSKKEAMSAKTDQLIRIAVVWREWNIAGLESNYCVFCALFSPLYRYSLPSMRQFVLWFPYTYACTNTCTWTLNMYTHIHILSNTHIFSWWSCRILG